MNLSFDIHLKQCIHQVKSLRLIFEFKSSGIFLWFLKLTLVSIKPEDDAVQSYLCRVGHHVPSL